MNMETFPLQSHGSQTTPRHPGCPSVSGTIYPTAEPILCHRTMNAPPPTDLSNTFQSKADRQINTNLYYLRPVSTPRSQVWAGGQKRAGGLYSGGIIVPVVVISAAATVITIRFDFIWECLHSCSPLTPLTPFFPPFHPLLRLLLLLPPLAPLPLD